MINEIEDPEVNPHTIYGHLIFFYKEVRNIQWKKDSIFNKWHWSNWMSECKRMQIDPYLSPCTKLKSKWVKDLNTKPDTLNLIEEKVRNILEHIGTGNKRIPISQALRSSSINGI